MPFNPLTGKSAVVTIGATDYAFDTIELPLDLKLPEVSNFTSVGYRQFVVGLASAEFKLSGPYDGGNMAFALGTTYSVVMKWSSSISNTVSAICKKIELKTNADDAARVTITFQSNGSFTTSIT